MNVTDIEKQAWWVVLLEGIAALVVGVLFLRAPGSSLLALTVLLGGYWFCRGIIGIIDVGVGPRETIGWRLFSAILSTAAGVFVLAHPVSSAGLLPIVYVIVLAVDALISGTVNIFFGAEGAGPGPVVLGVFDVLVGLLLLAVPYQAALAVPYVLGAAFIIGGVTLVGACLWLRSQQHHLGHEAAAA